MRRTTGAIVAVSTTLIVLALVATYFLVLAPPTSPASPSTDTVQFVIAKDPTSGLFAITPNATHLPANSVVRVSILNFDPENHSVPGADCAVAGTLNGTMMWSWMRGGMMGGGYGMGPQMRYNLSAAEVSHTFTLRSSGYDLNVPIPVAHSASDPSVVNFSFAVHGAAELPWSCEGAGMEPAMNGMMGSFWVD